MPASTVRDAAAARDSGPVALIRDRERDFRAVLPGSVDVTSFLGTAAGALYASPKLMEAAQASPDSLIIALMECAALGHLPGTDDYYLTPRKHKGKPEILGIEGYRGVIERMYRSGAVARVIVREVCENDKFSYVEGLDDKPRHVFGGEGGTGASFFGKGAPPRGEMVGVYAWAELTTGAVSRVVLLTRDDVHAARDAGGWRPDDPYSPWNRPDGGKDHPEFTGRAMWWKTAAKRLEPWVPTSAEFRREQLRASAASLAPARAPALPPGDDAVVDAEIIDDGPDPARPAIAPQAPAHQPPPGKPHAGATISQGELGALHVRLKKLGVTGQAERLELVSRLAGRAVTSTSELTGAEASAVLDALTGMIRDANAAAGPPDERAGISDEQAAAMTAGFRALGVTSRRDRLALVTSWIDREVTSAGELTAAEAAAVLVRLDDAVTAKCAEEDQPEGDEPDADA